MILKNAHILLPDTEEFFFGDLRIQEGVIAEIGSLINGEDSLDLQGQVLAPGFVDLHVHMREPGGEHKGDFASEGRAAAIGGYTHVFAMPNTRPTPDSKENFLYISTLSKKSPVPVTLYGSVTVGIAGEEFSDIEGLQELGCRFFTDDGMPIEKEEVMREALRRIGAFGGLLAVHEEERSLFDTGSIHRGPYAEQFGVDGIPSRAEWEMVERDIRLLEEVPGAHLHICHISAKESVELVQAAKERGLLVTAEVCPHHFALTQEEVGQSGTLAKVNPPLREEEDRRALIEGLKSGAIDIIATDHAPHDADSKARPMCSASFGLSGIELAFALGNTYLVEEGELTLPQLLRLMSEKPAKLAGINEGKIEVGAKANLVLLDPGETWSVRAKDLASKGKNTPLDGVALRGKVKGTLLEGEWIYEDTP